MDRAAIRTSCPTAPRSWPTEDSKAELKSQPLFPFLFFLSQCPYPGAHSLFPSFGFGVTCVHNPLISPRPPEAKGGHEPHLRDDAPTALTLSLLSDAGAFPSV